MKYPLIFLALCGMSLFLFSQDNPETRMPKEKIPKSEIKTVEGTFTGIEWGDYPHIKMKDKKGEEISFFCLDYCECYSNDKVKDSYSGKWISIGKMIRVQFFLHKKYLDAAGEDVLIDEVLSIEYVKK